MIVRKGKSHNKFEKIRREVNTLQSFNSRFDLNRGHKYVLDDEVEKKE